MPDDMNVLDEKEPLQLMPWILQHDPFRRDLASEILKQPWFLRGIHRTGISTFRDYLSAWRSRLKLLDPQHLLSSEPWLRYLTRPDRAMQLVIYTK